MDNRLLLSSAHNREESVWSCSNYSFHIGLNMLESLLYGTDIRELSIHSMAPEVFQRAGLLSGIRYDNSSPETTVVLVLIILAGFPATIQYEGTSFVTTLFAPITAPSPIVRPGNIVTLSPTQTFFPIITGILKFIFKIILPYSKLTEYPLLLSICSSLGMFLSFFLFLIYK